MSTQRLYWILLFVELMATTTSGHGAPRAAPFASIRDVCQNGRPAQRLSVYFAKRLPRPNPGTPLDEALKQEQAQVEKIREEAKRYFFYYPFAPLDRLKAQYTFLVEADAPDRSGIGVEALEINTALRYRSELWKQYIERFTVVEEAASDDPYRIRFAVSLDLKQFCRYRQRIEDLVTH